MTVRAATCSTLHSISLSSLSLVTFSSLISPTSISALRCCDANRCWSWRTQSTRRRVRVWLGGALRCHLFLLLSSRSDHCVLFLLLLPPAARPRVRRLLPSPLFPSLSSACGLRARHTSRRTGVHCRPSRHKEKTTSEITAAAPHARHHPPSPFLFPSPLLLAHAHRHSKDSVCVAQTKGNRGRRDQPAPAHGRYLTRADILVQCPSPIPPSPRPHQRTCNTARRL